MTEVRVRWPTPPSVAITWRRALVHSLALPFFSSAKVQGTECAVSTIKISTLLSDDAQHYAPQWFQSSFVPSPTKKRISLQAPFSRGDLLVGRCTTRQMFLIKLHCAVLFLFFAPFKGGESRWYAWDRVQIYAPPSDPR